MFTGIRLDKAPALHIPFRFFLTAPLFGVFAGLVILLQGEAPFQSSWEMEMFALTHLMTLGWLTMIMFGAYYQMLPVLAGISVPFIFLAKAVHFLLVIGIISLYAAFHFSVPLFFKVAFVSFLFAFPLFFVPIFISLFFGSRGKPTVWAMRISVISLIINSVLGLLFLWNYSFALDSFTIQLSVRRDYLIVLHASYGLVGWMLTLLIGIGFHVIPMFYLTPPFNEKKASQILLGILLTLVFLPIALFEIERTWAVYLSFLPAFFGLIIFVGEIFNLLKRRKRKVKDPTILFWETGMIIFYFVGGYFFLTSLVNDNKVFITVVGFLLFGVIGAIINGMLYKVIPFLVWFHRISAFIGKIPTPTMKDIISDHKGFTQWKVYLAALLFLGVGIALQSPLLLRVAGGLMIASYAYLFWIVVTAARIKMNEKG